VDVTDPLDPGAWADAACQEWDWLTARLARRLPPGAVEDVRQDIWLSWWTYRDRYQEAGRRRAFLRRLADRRISDWYRRFAGDAELPPMSAGDPDPDLVAQDLRACGIEPDSLLWRRILDEASLPSLAEDFRLPVGTVKSRLHYQGAELRRRLEDWHRDRLGLDPVCAHFRRGFLGARLCPRCADEWAAWRAVWVRSYPYRAFQASLVTVESALSVWLDCTMRVARWEEGDAGLCPVSLGPVRRLQDGRGRNLAARIRVTQRADGRFWTYAFRPGDDLIMHVSQRAAADQAEAAGVVRPTRSTVTIAVDIRYGGELDGSLVVEVPIGMTVSRVDPEPARVTRGHGRWLVMWTRAAALPCTPTIVARWS